MDAMVEMLTDADVAGRVGAGLAVETMRSAVLAVHRGDLDAPPRTMVDLGEGAFLFTSGRWGALVRLPGLRHARQRAR